MPAPTVPYITKPCPGFGIIQLYHGLAWNRLSHQTSPERLKRNADGASIIPTLECTPLIYVVMFLHFQRAHAPTMVPAALQTFHYIVELTRLPNNFVCEPA